MSLGGELVLVSACLTVAPLITDGPEHTHTMDQLCENFICNFVVEDNQQRVVVEIETISNPLCVYNNYGGLSHSYFCVLPKRKWGCYFGEKIPSE